jgi:acetoin utilization deacetylase AcuC-like enzyme
MGDNNDLVLFYPQDHAAHYDPGHPERPDRVEAIRQGLQEAGWWDDFPQLSPLPIPQDLLQAVHTPAFLNLLQEACRRGVHLDADTYTTPASWGLVLKNAGGAMAVASAVWQRTARRGFALTRPPGHHATARRGMGFCLLNNIALAAEYVLRQHAASRLAIVDLDLHHGNGTQDIFWQRGDVFFLSTHQSPFYPGTGRVDEVGVGPGEGRTANFPLPPGSGDQAFQTVMAELILPLLDRFEPEMILVSFGFDPHWRDPLGHLRLSGAVYNELIADLAQWTDENCNGRLALFLEGGYDLLAAKTCGQAAVAALLDRPWQDPLGPAPDPEGKSWQAMVRQAREIWGLD